jgi:flagellar capping protein FliD
MRKSLKITSLLLIASFAMTACGTRTIYNVPVTKIHAKSSSETVYNAIREAGTGLGWKITKIKPGVAEGKLALRSHVAVVRINYTNSSYSIRYVRSQNLKYNPKRQTIHSNYNGWIHNLEKAIDARL